MLGSFFSAAVRVGRGEREARRSGRTCFMRGWFFGVYETRKINGEKG
jgi:hypothetical protein